MVHPLISKDRNAIVQRVHTDTYEIYFGVGLGLLVAKFCGEAGFMGITSMAMIAGITNSAGGLYLGLAQQYGDETDAGAISILSLNDGPFSL